MIYIKNCPICTCELSLSEETSSLHKNSIYSCRAFTKNHMYSLLLSEDSKILKFKLRLTNDDDSKITCKIHYDSGYSEVWTGISFNLSDRININHIIELDFSNIEKIKKKLKTYMLFS